MLFTNISVDYALVVLRDKLIMNKTIKMKTKLRANYIIALTNPMLNVHILHV